MHKLLTALVRNTALLQLPALSLYIHIPWCIRKCPYCDFNSHALNNQPLPEAAYMEQLIKDFENEKSGVSERSLKSIFIGGGTPSLFSPKTIDILLSSLEKRITFASDIEITMEANPGTFEQKKFTGFRAAGINRLSLGIQSFNNNQLHKLGRIHNGEDALKAASRARKSGFQNINLDIMHGLAEQTPDQAMADLSMAMALEPEHISWYQLTIEPNTVFYSRPPRLPEDEILWDIQEAGFDKMQQAGFIQYEISAWSKAGRQSRHNLNYWQFGDYIGIGAGAHGKITTSQAITRRWKTRIPSAYLQKSMNLVAGERILSAEELPLEFFLNTMRLKEGVPAKSFTHTTGLPLSVIQNKLEMLHKKGFITSSHFRLQPTETGQRFLNDLLGYFI